MPRHGGATQREQAAMYVHDDDGRGLRALSREELFVSGRGGRTWRGKLFDGVLPASVRPGATSEHSVKRV